MSPAGEVSPGPRTRKRGRVPETRTFIGKRKDVVVKEDRVDLVG